MRKLMVLSVVAALCGGSMIVACGDDKPAQAPVVKVDAAPAAPLAKVEAPAPAPVKVASEPVKGASISGTVKVKGDVKKRKKIKMDADPKCSAMHAEPPLNEDIVVDGNGNVQWAFVYVKKGAEG